MTHVVIVGAGPAGLAAAEAALEAGGDVTLLDGESRVGGQFWRHPPAPPAAPSEKLLQHRWGAFTSLREVVEDHRSCHLVLDANVWAVDLVAGRPRLWLAVGEPDGSGRSMRALTPDSLVLATGAHDLTLPFPGWDLPGVFTGGAAQALAKAEHLSIGKRVVVAGSGPFLFPVTASLLATGASVCGVHEASRVPRLAGWLRHSLPLAMVPGKFGELAGYVAGLTRARVPYRTGSAVIAAHGEAAVEAVTTARLDTNWAPVPGTERRIAADAVAITHGFVPRLELAVAVGCRLTEIGPFDRFVVVDDDQRTSVSGVFAAGEVTGIAGADAALTEGRLAGWLAAGGDPDNRWTRLARAGLRASRTFQRGLAAVHGIGPGWTQWLTDETLVCRCEETTYGQVRQVLEATEGRGLRALKLLTRAGLGPCQGRICGRVVEGLAAQLGRARLLDGALPDQRPLATPIRFGELAQITGTAKGR